MFLYLVLLPALLSLQSKSPYLSQQVTVYPSLDHQLHQPCVHCVTPVRVLQKEQFSSGLQVPLEADAT